MRKPSFMLSLLISAVPLSAFANSGSDSVYSTPSYSSSSATVPTYSSSSTALPTYGDTSSYDSIPTYTESGSISSSYSGSSYSGTGYTGSSYSGTSYTGSGYSSSSSVAPSYSGSSYVSDTVPTYSNTSSLGATTGVTVYTATGVAGSTYTAGQTTSSSVSSSSMYVEPTIAETSPAYSTNISIAEPVNYTPYALKTAPIISPMKDSVWSVFEEQDPMDDETFILISNAAIDDSDATLFIKCQNARPSIFIQWDEALSGEYVQVKTRLGENTAEKDIWPLSRKGKATIYPKNPWTLIDGFKAVDTFLVQAEPFRGDVKRARFDMGRLHEVTDSFDATCPRPVKKAKKKKYKDVS